MYMGCKPATSVQLARSGFNLTSAECEEMREATAARLDPAGVVCSRPMKTLLIGWALATATLWAGTAAELEFKLQHSYNQRATNDDRKGLRSIVAR